jgi:hypothetical protein
MTAQEPINYHVIGPKRDVMGCPLLTDLYSVLMVILRQFLMKVLGRKILVLLLFGQKSAGNKLVSSHETQMTAQEPFHILFMGPKRDVVGC